MLGKKLAFKLDLKFLHSEFFGYHLSYFVFTSWIFVLKMNLLEAFAAKIEPLIKILNFYSLLYYNEANMSAAWDLSLAISQGQQG